MLKGLPDPFEIGRRLRGLLSCSAMVLLCAAGAADAFGQVRPEGLFTEDRIAWTPRPGFGAERATLRSRSVRADLGRLTAERRAGDRCG